MSSILNFLLKKINEKYIKEMIVYIIFTGLFIPNYMMKNVLII